MPRYFIHFHSILCIYYTLFEEQKERICIDQHVYQILSEYNNLCVHIFLVPQTRVKVT